MLVPDSGKVPHDPDVVKSLVIRVAGSPAVVLLRGGDRLDDKKLASTLGVARRQVRLATHAEAVAACGYVPGTVPPFGHRARLPTLVDMRLVALVQGPGALVYTGGGDPHVEMALDVATLVEHTDARVADVAAEAGIGCALELPPALPTATTTRALPLPWAPGSPAVSLVAVVALRRRVSKVLQFCTLVPEATPTLPPHGRAAHLRRLWADPERVEQVHGGGNGSGDPCEVQLIMGKTLERSLGRDNLLRLMDAVRPGAIIRVLGRPQPTRRSRQAAAGSPALQSAAGVASPAVLPAPGVVHDLVAHHVEVLHRGQDRLERELAQERRRQQQEGGGDGPREGGPNTAGLLLWQRQRAALLTRLNGGPDQTSTGAAGVQVMRRPRGAPQPASGGHEVDNSKRTHNTAAHDVAASTAGPGPSAPLQYWQPAGLQPVWVDNAAGIALVRRAIADGIAAAVATPGSLPPPVGLDCEWVPYARGEAPTPVALLQVALRGPCVFLIDLLAVAGPAGSVAAGDASARRELGGLLQDVLCSGGAVTPLGFQLSHDIRRLLDSYPWLMEHVMQRPDSSRSRLDGAATLPPAHPALQASSGPLPAMAGLVYTDVLRLARAARPEAFLYRMGVPHTISLSRLVQDVFGMPLDKGCQRSDWAARPLNAAQLAYAAADVASLVALHDELLQRQA